MRIRKYGLPLLAIGGLGIASAMVIRGNPAAPGIEPMGEPARPPFASYIYGPGIIEASTGNIAIGTPAPGIVTDVYVKWGDAVVRGDPLFRVDTRDLEAQLGPARATVREIEGRLAVARAGVHEAKVMLAKAEYRVTLGSGLKPGVSITDEDMANRRFDMQADSARVVTAEARLADVHAQVATAMAQVRQIEQEIAIRTVRAPVTGRILRLNLRVGEYAASASLRPPLILLGDVSRLFVRVDIDEADTWRFRACAPAVASLRGNAGVRESLRYVRTEPALVPQALLTGDATQRTDVRVLQVIYSFDPGARSFYVGQLMDAFIEAAPTGGREGSPGSRSGPCDSGPASERGAVKARKP